MIGSTLLSPKPWRRFQWVNHLRSFCSTTIGNCSKTHFMALCMKINSPLTSMELIPQPWDQGSLELRGQRQRLRVLLVVSLGWCRIQHSMKPLGSRVSCTILSNRARLTTLLSRCSSRIRKLKFRNPRSNLEACLTREQSLKNLQRFSRLKIWALGSSEPTGQFSVSQTKISSPCCQESRLETSSSIPNWHTSISQTMTLSD